MPWDWLGWIGGHEEVHVCPNRACRRSHRKQKRSS